MTIFGLTGAEITMLERWQRLVGLPFTPTSDREPFADICELRKAWLEADGPLPVRECDVAFVRPKNQTDRPF